MKKYLYSFLTLLALILIGCGSDNDKSFSVYDDGNGTKSPRISKVIREDYSDGNITYKYEDRYKYDENNSLLINVEVENNDDYPAGYTYSYSTNKQLIEKSYGSFYNYSTTEYKYSNSLYMHNTNLPVLISKERSGSTLFIPEDGSIEYYHYELNKEGKATRLKNITIQNRDRYTLTYSKEKEYKSYIYDSNGKVIQVLYANGDKEIFRYDDRQHIKSIEHYSKDSDNGYLYIMSKENFIYKGDLLKVKEVYYRSKENEKFELSSKKTYTYENKPYYEAPSLVHINEKI